MAAPSFLPQMKLTLFFIISSFLITDAQLTYIHPICYEGFGKYNILSDYGTNIKRAINELATRASTSYFGNSTTGLGQEKVNALFSCRYDITPEVCQSCVASTAKNISWCFSNVEGLIVYEECILHYSNRTIFGVMEELPQLYLYSTGEEDARFIQLLENTVTDLITQTTSEFLVSSRYLATTTAKYSSSETIYALAQCNPDITSLECRTCLQSGFDGFNVNYTGSNYGQIFAPSCRLSYILSSEEPSQPWKFKQTFDQLNQPRYTPYPPRFSPRYYSPSTGSRTRGSSIIGAIIASISSIYCIVFNFKSLL